MRSSRGAAFLVVASAVVTRAASPILAAPPEVPNLQFVTAGKLAWDPVSPAAGYHLYRGSVSGLRSGDYGACRSGSLQAPTANVPETPPANDGQIFLVTAFDASGEGIATRDSGGGAHGP